MIFGLAPVNTNLKKGKDHIEWKKFFFLLLRLFSVDQVQESIVHYCPPHTRAKFTFPLYSWYCFSRRYDIVSGHLYLRFSSLYSEHKRKKNMWAHKIISFYLPQLSIFNCASIPPSPPPHTIMNLSSFWLWLVNVCYILFWHFPSKKSTNSSFLSFIPIKSLSSDTLFERSCIWNMMAWWCDFWFWSENLCISFHHLDCLVFP